MSNFKISEKVVALISNPDAHCQIRKKDESSTWTENVQSLKYVLDFEVEYSDGTKLLVDTKGMPTESAKIKLKIFNYKYPNEKLVWVSWSSKDGGWIIYQDLLKLRAKRKKEKGNNNDAKNDA